MRTFITNLAAEPSPQGHLSVFKHWLFVRREALRYALAPFAVALAFVARLALTPVLGDASPYLLFVPAVLTAAGLAGSDRDCWQPASASCSASSPSRCL